VLHLLSVPRMSLKALPWTTRRIVCARLVASAVRASTCNLRAMMHLIPSVSLVELVMPVCSVMAAVETVVAVA
jgi:hypothetical protein